ncbi:MAG TPA: PAS domain S-box protein, partial [Gemmatirosa sp.]
MSSEYPSPESQTRRTAGAIARWRRRGATVGTGLILLAGGATAPFIVLTGWRARTRAIQARAAAQARALETARHVASRLDERSRIIQTLLSALAQQVRTSSAGTTANDSLLLAVKNTLPEPVVTNLWVQARSGANIGTSHRPIPTRAAIDASDRQYFQTAVATGRPTIGDPLQARPDTGVWSVIFAQPVLARPGVAAVVLGTVHLETLGRILDTDGLPPGSSIVLADARGQIAARVPAAPGWIGRPVDALVRPPRALSSVDGATIDADAGGPRRGRLVAALHARVLPWRVYVIVPASAAFAPVTHELRRDVALGVLTCGVAILLAIGAARGITRPLGDLAADATALAAGDYARRTPVDLPGELGTLAATFDEMAATITARTAELHRSEQRYRSLFESSPLPMYLADVGTYAILAANDAAVAQYGYSREEFTQRTLLDLRPESERLTFLAEARAWPPPPAVGSRRAARIWRHLRRDGSEFDAEVYTGGTEYEGRPARLSVAVDVTARREAERALEESQEQLRRGQKMEALGRFA